MEVEMAVHAGTAAPRNDRRQRYNALVTQICGEISGGRDFVNPPNWIGVRVEPSEREFIGEKAAGGKIVGQTFVEPFGKVQVSYFRVELMHRLVKHLVVRVNF